MRLDNISKYLDRYADPLSRPPPFSGPPYSHAIVIPARAEEKFFQELGLPSLTAAAARFERVLLILVVNARQGDGDEIFEKNRLFTRDLIGHETADSFVLHSHSDRLDILVCNASDGARALGPKEGVGRARKIGSDLFVWLWRDGWIRSPWIFASDADVIFSEDYFLFAEELRNREVVLGNIPFSHFALPSMSDFEKRAIAEYDFFLRYYRAGLESAGTRYAHPTIGSTQVIRADAYVDVRGYPNLQAGEDFYLATKLLKVGEAHSPQTTPLLQLSGRVSTRVPFGTGTSVKKISQAWEASSDYHVYHPAVFAELGHLLECLKRACAHRNWEVFSRDLMEGSCHGEWIARHLARERESFVRLWTLSPSAEKLWRHTENHFDAFRILRFIHELRDGVLPSVTLSEARALRDRAPKLHFPEPIPVPMRN